MSAAFILIGGKVGDPHRAQAGLRVGLLGYAIGALAMARRPGLTAVIIFWAVGADRRLSAAAGHAVAHPRQLRRRRRRNSLRPGQAAAIAAAVGPLLGGFITTYLSWRVGFVLEVVIIAVVLSCIKLVRDVAYTGPRTIDVVGALLSVLGHAGGLVLGILAWQGGRRIRWRCWPRCDPMGALAYWLVRRKRAGSRR